MSGMTGLGVQFQPKGTDYLEDRVEARATFPRKGLVEAFAGQSGVSGDLGHTFGAGDVAKSLGDKGGISVCFFQAGVQISSHFLRGSQVLCNVIASGSGLGQSGYSERFRARRKAVLMSLA